MKKIFFLLSLTTVLMASPTLIMADGAGDFAAKCAACHGADGKGKAAMATAFKVTPDKLDLTDTDAVKCATMVKSGGGAMKPVSSLDDAAIQAVCAHAESL